MLKISAALTGITGAILLALNVGYSYQAYIIFWISSTLWMLIGKKENDKPLLVMNIVFTIINTIGLIRYY